MNTFKKLESKIDDTLELSTVCRGEWCRYLESDMDGLGEEMHEYLKSGEVNERFCLHTVSEKFRRSYKNLGPVFMFAK